MKSPNSGSFSKSSPVQVEAVVASYQQFNQEIKLPGKLIASEQIEIRSEINAKVMEIYFNDAQTVKKNQILVKLNDEEIQAKLNKLKVQEALLKATVQRQQELYKNAAIGQSEYELSLLQYKNTLSDIRITEAELRKYFIRAPFDGLLGFRKISPGDLIGSTDVVSTLTQVFPIKLGFAVPEQYSNLLKLQQKVIFNCENINKQYEAIIKSFSPFLNDESKTLEILAQVVGKDPLLRPGAYASIQLDLAQKDNGIFIPSQCIIPRIKDKQVALFKEGKVEFSTVTVGYRDSARVEILSGIVKGDTVISTGLMKLKPGMTVILSNLN